MIIAGGILVLLVGSGFIAAIYMALRSEGTPPDDQLYETGEPE